MFAVMTVRRMRKTKPSLLEWSLSVRFALLLADCDSYLFLCTDSSLSDLARSRGDSLHTNRVKLLCLPNCGCSLSVTVTYPHSRNK
jgi:hypothetical protein